MIKSEVLLTSAVATSESVAIPIEDFDKAIFTVHTVGATTATIKFVAGFKDAPDFGSAASATNDWHYIDTVDTDTGTAVNGSTGYSLSGTGLSKAYQWNIDGAKYVGVVITAWTAGAITADVLKLNHNFI